MRFHVDLQGPSGMTGHHQLDDAIAAPALGRGVLGQAQEAWLAVDEGTERLSDDDRLGAAPTDPALDRAIGMDDPRRAGTRGCRPLDRHDRGHSERSTCSLELGCPPEDRPRHQLPATPLSWRMAQTFWGVMGMSMLRTPRCHRASTTAL